MSNLEKEKQQEIENMVEILKQIDLPDIILLTRDANTLLMRQMESKAREEAPPMLHLSVGEIKDGYANCNVRLTAAEAVKK